VHRAALVAALAACGSGSSPSSAPIRFLHTFAPDETEQVNAAMAERDVAVESSLVPFARGQQVISEILAAGKDCPDLIRIDATWLPGLAAADLLQPVPPELVQLDWLPEAAALVDPTASPSGDAARQDQVPARDPTASPSGDAARQDQVPARETTPWLAVPQTVDGLVVLRDDSALAPSSPSLDDLAAAARAAKTPERRFPLGLRVDGYWLVPWLRADGADLSVTMIAGDGAERALAGFAALFGDLAAPPPPAGSEAPDELRRWNAHDVAYWVTGPWQLGTFHDREHLAVSPIAHAPRGGQLLVVPKCARRASDGWRLAGELTSVPVELSFAQTFGTVPSRRAALDAAPPIVHAIYAALDSAEMLPRSPITPLLFDDLNPALAAVVAGDATAREALAGVRRGWRRLEPK